MTEWRSTSTAELIDDGVLEIGDGYRAKNAEFRKHGIPFLRIGNLDEGRLLLDGADLFPEENLNKVASKVSRPKDCVIATKATIGRLVYLDESSPRVLYSPQVSYWRVVDESVLEPRFIRCWLAGREFQVQAFQTKSSTSMADYINLRDQRQMRITLPPLHTQRTIAAVVAAYDELIENNLRRIEILDEMAQAVYREWFVNFRYPGHENAPLVDSPLGPIPKAWGVSTLGDVSIVVMGQSPKSEFYNDTGDGLPFHQGVSNFGSHFPVHSKYCTVETRVAEPGDVLVSVRAPVGRINVADTRLVIGRGLAAVRPVDRSVGFHYRQLRHVFREEDAMGGGTIYKAITKGGLLGIQWLVPPGEIRAAFDELERPMFKLISNLTRQNRNLRATRDLLLPKLVSGEIDVSDLHIDTEWLAS